MLEKKKILLINGSPKKEQSGSYKMASAFVKGMMNSGNFSLDTVTVSSLSIKPCRGCLSCWAKEDSQCVMTDDDIPVFREKIRSADTIVLSMPLFFFGFPGTVKTMMDRLLGMVQPYCGLPMPKNGLPLHEIIGGDKAKQIVIICSCAWLEEDVISIPLLKQLDLILGSGNYTFLITSQMNALQYHSGGRRLHVKESQYENAGEEFAHKGTVSDETKSLLKKHLFSDSTYRLFFQNTWRRNDGEYLLNETDEKNS